MQIREDRAELGAQHGKQRQLRRLEDGDLDALGTCRGRDFQSDPAGADDGQPGTRRNRAEQRIGIVHATQREHPARIEAGQAERAGPRPRGQRELVVTELGTVRQPHGVRRPVDRGYLGAQQQVDVGMFVEQVAQAVDGVSLQQSGVVDGHVHRLIEGAPKQGVVICDDDGKLAVHSSHCC